MWLDEEDLYQVVNDNWLHPRGVYAVDVHFSKLRRLLRSVLSKWEKHTFGNVKTLKDSIMEEIQAL